MEWTEKSNELKTDRQPLNCIEVNNCRNCNTRFEDLNIQIYKNKIGNILFCEDCFVGSPQVLL